MVRLLDGLYDDYAFLSQLHDRTVASLRLPAFHSSEHSPNRGSSSRQALCPSSQPKNRSQSRSQGRRIASDDRTNRGIAASDDRANLRRPATSESPDNKQRHSSHDRGNRRRLVTGESPEPKRRRSSLASSEEDLRSAGRTQSVRSSSPPASPPPQEDKEQDDPATAASVQGVIDFILKTFPDAQASPSHPSSMSFDVSAIAGISESAISSDSLLAWSRALVDSFSDTQKRFSWRVNEGKSYHTLLPSLNKFEKVSNSPTQGGELKANPDIFDLLRNKVPDSRYVPLSLKEAAVLERALRSMLETHSFLIWSVAALLRSLHDMDLLPKDHPVISQLQKSFSKACGNMASGLSSSAAFVTLKRRQLLLSHVVPSVSDAQKRRLLSDPLFNTGLLFDSSSVEAALSAARDISLFKPHLKSSSSTNPPRRSNYSGSSFSRAHPRPSTFHSTSQRSSPPRHFQSGKKGDSRFHKKSSEPHQKRGGFRK